MRRTLGAFALTLLCGCAAVDRAAVDRAAAPVPEARDAVPATSASKASELAAYLARLRGMSEAGLAAEAARQRRDSSDLGRVKAALALSLSPQSDDADILALVEAPAKKDNGDRDVRAMASFLQVVVSERRRLKEGASAAGARLREERRLLEAQKQRADALQQKLDALTDLEKSLSDRPTPNR